MIACIEPIESGFTLTDPDDPRHQYITDLKQRFGSLESMTQEQLKTWDADTAIWRTTQETIASVKAAYERLYSLNTAVSMLNEHADGGTSAQMQ